MYIVKEKHRGSRIDFTRGGSIYLDNSTPQDVLEKLFNEKHPAVDFKKTKKIKEDIDE